MRFHSLAIVVCLMILLVGCQQAVLDEEIHAMVPDCGRADAQIALLDQEKAQVNDRVASGIKTIVPVSAIVHLFRGELRREAKIATGEYNQLIESKISEIKSDCAV